MKTKAKLYLPIVALLMGIVLAVAILKARPEVERREAEVLPPLVRVVETVPQDLTLTVLSQGTITPSIESSLVAQVAGRIEWVSPTFAEGGFFQRGEKLVQIEDRDYLLAVSQAEAQVARARVQLEREQAEADLARDEWQELGDGDATPLTLREPQLAEARAGLKAAEAGLEKARLDLARTSIRSLFDGRVRDTRVDLGQFVTPGTPLASVYGTGAAELRLPVPKQQLAYLGLDLGYDSRVANPAGPRVLLRAEIGGAAQTWQGVIVRSGSEFDPKTRMLPLIARIEDPFQRRSGAEGATLPMGLFVEAEISGIELEAVVALPRVALRGDNQVLVVDDESRLRFRGVDVLRLEGERLILRSGVEAGELVCVSPLEAVVDGMRVRTVMQSESMQTAAQREERL
jgi:RND family efflux transporter MFP subunit